MKIEKAQYNDVQSICKLYRALFADMSVQQPSYYQAGVIEEHAVRQFIDSDEGVLLIAREDEVVIGFVYAMKQKTPAYGPFILKNYGVLSDLVVDNAYRGKGIGTALIRAAKQWAKSNKLDYLEIHVLPENAKAFHLYKLEGFETVMHIMRIAL